MRQRQIAKRFPFHQTIQMALSDMTTGQHLQRRHLRAREDLIKGYLELIRKTFIPLEAFPSMIRTCERARDTFRQAGLEGLALAAAKTVENLQTRTQEDDGEQEEG